MLWTASGPRKTSHAPQIQPVDIGQQKCGYCIDVYRPFKLRTEELVGCTAVGIIGVLRESEIKFGYLSHIHPSTYLQGMRHTNDTLAEMKKQGIVLAQSVVLTHHEPNDKTQPKYPWASELLEALTAHEHLQTPRLWTYAAPGRARNLVVSVSLEKSASWIATNSLRQAALVVRGMPGIKA